MTDDENRPRRLRDVAEQLAATIPDAPARGRDVSNEPRIPKGQPGGGQWTTDGSSQSTSRTRQKARLTLQFATASALMSPDGNSKSPRLANTHTPAPFLDDHHNPVQIGRAHV